MKEAKIVLKFGKEKPLLNHHPWVFSGAVDRIDADGESSGPAVVVDHKGRFLGRGYFNTASQIVARLLTFRDEAINSDFFGRRIADAVALRTRFINQETTDAYRLFNSEGDLLSGLIVDSFAGYLSVQFLTKGIEYYRETILAELTRIVSPKGIVLRNDSAIRKDEGLGRSIETIGDDIPAEVVIRENGYRFRVSLTEGQKTGYFLDQRDNRSYLATFAKGKTVLDAFSYTGGFGIYALGAGATQVKCVDMSKLAIATAQTNFAENGFAAPDNAFVCADFFDYSRSSKERFDVVILDPPKFAASKDKLGNAMNGYKDISIGGISLLAPGGILAVFSCTAAIDMRLLQMTVFEAAADLHCDLSIIRYLGHGPDHPVSIFHPGGHYLNGLVCVRRS